MAGGKGTRLAPYTHILPKPLMPIIDQPILEIVIKQLAFYNFNRITICTGHLSSLIQTFFGNGEKFEVDIDYSVEETPLGTTGPLKLVKNIKRPFLVMNGDLLTTLNMAEMFDSHLESKADITIGVYKKIVKLDLGIIELDKSGLVVQYNEKPDYNYLASSGIYILNPEVLDFIPKNKYYDFPDLIKRMIQNKLNVMTYNIDGIWLDIGREEDYKLAIEIFKKDKDKFFQSEK